jgi:hypothetical protein
MSFASTRWLPRMGAFACLLAVAACSDDDGPVTPTPTRSSHPTGVAGTSPSPTSARVTWSAVTGATSYEVDRATGTGSFAPAGTPTATELVVSGLSPETEYRFRVRALRGTEQGPYSTEATVRTSNRATVQVTADITTNTTWTSENIYQLTA